MKAVIPIFSIIRFFSNRKRAAIEKSAIDAQHAFLALCEDLRTGLRGVPSVSAAAIVTSEGATDGSLRYEVMLRARGQLNANEREQIHDLLKKFGMSDRLTWVNWIDLPADTFSAERRFQNVMLF